jgi:hypothetical protein
VNEVNEVNSNLSLWLELEMVQSCTNSFVPARGNARTLHAGPKQSTQIQVFQRNHLGLNWHLCRSPGHETLNQNGRKQKTIDEFDRNVTLSSKKAQCRNRNPPKRKCPELYVPKLKHVIHLTWSCYRRTLCCTMNQAASLIAFIISRVKHPHLA